MFQRFKTFLYFFLLVVTKTIQFPGEECSFLDSNNANISGICMSTDDCNHANKKLVKQNRLPFCEIYDNSVCCPVTSSKQGDSCIIRNYFNDIAGECKPMEECENAKSLLKKLQEMKWVSVRHTCYLNDNLVCCPLQKFRSVETKAGEKCLEYGHERGKYVAIFSGKEALPEEFPHMAAVGLRDNSETLWFCGGSLISENFVLTAAHCTSYRGQPPTLVGLGNIALKDDRSPPQEFGIIKVFRHPNYTFASYYHDIGLLKLQCKIDIGTFAPRSIFPACLHTEEEIPTQLEATGWGLTERGEKSNTLLKVTLNVSDHTVCSASFAKVFTRKLRRNIDKEIQICAGGSGYDTCQGDSGGPLHYSVPENELTGDENYVIAGITSFGKNGCGAIGVYTRVSAYIPWIESIVWPLNETSNLLEEPRCKSNSRPVPQLEGDTCTLRDNYGFLIDGICTNIHKCGYAKQLIQRGLQLPICGFNGRHYLMCCLPQAITCDYCYYTCC